LHGIRAWYSLVMAQRKNLTLAIDLETLDEVRIYAARRGTTVNALVRSYLVELASQDARRKEARSEIRQMMHTGLVTVGERSWTRDELHQR